MKLFVCDFFSLTTAPAINKFFPSLLVLFCASLFFMCIEEPKAIKETNICQMRFQFVFVMLEEENPLVDYWKVEGGPSKGANVQWDDWEGMARGIFSICTGMQGGSLTTLLLPEGGQWERVQNRKVICTESQMCAFHFDTNLSLERKMPGYCISTWTSRRNLAFQIGQTCYCQLHGIEDRENDHIFHNEEEC